MGDKALKFNWKQKRIEFYLAAVIIPSIMLAVFALWALARQYELINYKLKAQTSLSLAETGWLSSFNRISLFAFAMVAFSLLLVLLISSYLSSRDVEKQLEITRLKSEFVSVVTHEFKTPLTSIRLLAERLLKLEPQEAEKQKEYHSLILTQCSRLSRLINNILDFSKLEEGKQQYKFEKADLAGLLKQSLEDYPVHLIRPDCKLEINLSPVPPLYLDKEALPRAFINLLDNALKFSPAQGQVKVSLYKDNSKVVIEVADQGPGLDTEEQKLLFERFYHTGKGTGLGLKIARHIVEGHFGKIELESQKGRGSVFKIILPLREPA